MKLLRYLYLKPIAAVLFSLLFSVLALAHPADVLIVSGPGGHESATEHIARDLKAAGISYARFDFSSLSDWTFEQTLAQLEVNPQASADFYEDYYRKALQVESIADLPQAEWHRAHEFMAVLNVVKPKVIISDYAISMETFKKLQEQGQIAGMPIGTVPTDQHLNRYWTYQIPTAATKVFAPTEDWAKTSIDYGTDPDKIVVTGIPGHPNFDRVLTPEEVKALWQGLGFDPKVYTVFVGGGSGGVGTYDKMLASIRQEFEKEPKTEVQVIFATGSSTKAFNQIAEAQSTMPANIHIKPLAFTPFIADYVNYIADSVVTKAGGLTTSEVSRARGKIDKDGKVMEGRPMICTIPTFGIETGNTDFLFERKMAMPSLVEAIGSNIRYLMNNPSAAKEMMAKQDIIRSATHPELITQWAAYELQKLNATKSAPFIKAENTSWVFDKLEAAKAAGKKPILIFSDATNDQLIAEGQALKAQAAAAKAKEEQARASLRNTNKPVVRVAITVDDLPLGSGEFPTSGRRETLKAMIDILLKHHVPGVYGFVNSEVVNGWTEVEMALKDWVRAGYPLGNHTHSHHSLTKSTADAFIQDIESADKFLAAMGVPNHKYFRYPFLQEGDTPEKRQKVLDYLWLKGYKVAPVTLDIADYNTNDKYLAALKKGQTAKMNEIVAKAGPSAVRTLRGSSKLAKQIFGRDISHVMLLHLAEVNTKMLDDILTRYENEGVEFVTLDRALADPAYRVDHGRMAAEMGGYLEEMAYATGLWTIERGQKSVRPTREQKAAKRSACRMIIDPDEFSVDPEE